MTFLKTAKMALKKTGQNLTNNTRKPISKSVLYFDIEVNRKINRLIFNWVSKAIRIFTGFALLPICDWLKKTRATLSTNKMHNRHQSRLCHVRFGALASGQVYFLRCFLSTFIITVTVALVWLFYTHTRTSLFSQWNILTSRYFFVPRQGSP